MTRTLKRQLEEELDAEKNLGFDPSDIKNLRPEDLITPRDDDTYSPMHVEEDNTTPATPSSDESEKTT